jgi:hypothetical protein
MAAGLMLGPMADGEPDGETEPDAEAEADGDPLATAGRPIGPVRHEEKQIPATSATVITAAMPARIRGRSEVPSGAYRSRRALIDASTRLVARTELAGAIDR